MDGYSESYKKRLEEFGRGYEDFETFELVKLVQATGNFLEQLTGEPDAVDAAMKALYKKTAGYPTDGKSWQEVWSGATLNVGVFRTSSYLADLNAYGYYGLAPDSSLLDAASTPVNEANREQLYETYLKKGREFLQKVPTGWASLEDINRTILAAEARFGLDFGREISIEQLAAIARMTPKSIRNLLTPKSGEIDLRVTSNGMISAADALRWLSKREDFKASIWNEAEGEKSHSHTPDTSTIEEVVFVPVAKDGSAFDPVTCKNGRGYTIGPKGAEVPVDNYFEAISLLSKASTPHWRRPNENGNWGIVAGVSWQRWDAAELKKLIKGQH